jgi:CRISPR-associated protein Csb2
LRALVATFHRARPAEINDELLACILDTLSSSPPVFQLPPAATAHTRHYDIANGSVKFFDAFVALDPEASLLWLWPEAELASDERRALSALFEALGTFGRAESWCEIELLGEDAVRGEPSTTLTTLVNSKPIDGGDLLKGDESVRVLVPASKGPALMKSLLEDTATMRKRKQLEPRGAHWVTYTRRSDALTARQTRPRRSAIIKDDRKVARFALDSTVLPLVTDALPFAESVRRALIRNRADTSHSEAITGKSVAGVPLEGHEHAHYFATDEDGDGRLDHVSIYCPRGFDEADVEALGSLRTIYRHGNRPEVRMILIGLSGVERFAQRGSRPDLKEADRDVCAPGSAPSAAPSVFAISKRWRSVTPFSLPRFPNRGGGKPPRPRDLPEAQLRRELVARGLPEPISIKRIEGYQPNGRPLVRWLEFHTQRFKGTQGKGLAGFEIEFGEPVAGPIAVGFGCHFGLGLFMPC